MHVCIHVYFSVVVCIAILRVFIFLLLRKEVEELQDVMRMHVYVCMYLCLCLSLCLSWCPHDCLFIFYCGKHCFWIQFDALQKVNSYIFSILCSLYRTILQLSRNELYGMVTCDKNLLKIEGCPSFWTRELIYEPIMTA